MASPGARWLEQAKRFESWLLSDRRLPLKQWLSWMSVLALIAYCGVGSERVYRPSLLEYLLQPSQYEGAPFSVTFVPIMPYTHGSGYVLRTLFGWFPLSDSYRTDAPNVPHSVSGVWHADGTVSVTDDWSHPLRPVKTIVSAVTSAALCLALAYHYGPRVLRARKQ